MNRNILRAGFKILKNKLLRERKPLIVAFGVTNTCNKDCAYCVSGRGLTERRLEKDEFVKIFEELENLGTEIISFSGGEPLLREDIDEIVSYGKSKNFYVSLNSNGSLVREKKDVVENLDQLTLSIEGDKKTHDKIRGKGSFKEVTQAVETAKDMGVAVKLAPTVNKYNWNKIESLLDIAREFDCKMSFQPVLQTKLFSEEENPLSPESWKMKQAFKKLIREKKKGNSQIFNSLSNLRHLLNFPEPTKMKCERISCRVTPDGYVKQCGRDNLSDAKNVRNVGFKAAFNNLSDKTCFNCWCAERAALCQIYSLNFNCAREYLQDLL